MSKHRQPKPAKPTKCEKLPTPTRVPENIYTKLPIGEGMAGEGEGVDGAAVGAMIQDDDELDECGGGGAMVEAGVGGVGPNLVETISEPMKP